MNEELLERLVIAMEYLVEEAKEAKRRRYDRAEKEAYTENERRNKPTTNDVVRSGFARDGSFRFNKSVPEMLKTND